MKPLHEMIREFEPKTDNPLHGIDRESFEEMREVALMLAEAIEYNKSKYNEWIDKGHWCDSKKVLQSVVDSSNAAINKARKLLGEK